MLHILSVSTKSYHVTAACRTCLYGCCKTCTCMIMQFLRKKKKKKTCWHFLGGWPYSNIIGCSPLGYSPVTMLASSTWGNNRAWRMDAARGGCRPLQCLSWSDFESAIRARFSSWERNQGPYSHTKKKAHVKIVAQSAGDLISVGGLPIANIS